MRTRIVLTKEDINALQSVLSKYEDVFLELGDDAIRICGSTVDYATKKLDADYVKINLGLGAMTLSEPG